MIEEKKKTDHSHSRDIVTYAGLMAGSSDPEKQKQMIDRMFYLESKAGVFERECMAYMQERHRQAGDWTRKGRTLESTLVNGRTRARSLDVSRDRNTDAHWKDAAKSRPRRRLTKIYEQYNPDKLKDELFIDKTLKRYAGNHATLFARLEAKYRPQNPNETCSEETNMQAGNTGQHVSMLSSSFMAVKMRRKSKQAKYNLEHFKEQSVWSGGEDSEEDDDVAWAKGESTNVFERSLSGEASCGAARRWLSAVFVCAWYAHRYMLQVPDTQVLVRVCLLVLLCTADLPQVLKFSPKYLYVPVCSPSTAQWEKGEGGRRSEGGFCAQGRGGGEEKDACKVPETRLPRGRKTTGGTARDGGRRGGIATSSAREGRGSFEGSGGRCTYGDGT